MSQIAPSTRLNLSPDDARSLDLMRTRIAPMLQNINQLQSAIEREMHLGAPDFSTIARHCTLLKTHQDNFQKYLSDGFRKDEAHPTNAEILSSLHAFPQPPFPSAQSGGLIATLTKKKLEVRDETWVDAAVAKAAEFCRISENVDLGPQKKLITPKREGDEERVTGIKRTKTCLAEDDIESLWKDAISTHVGQMFYFEKIKGNLEGEEGEEEGEEEERKIERLREELGIEMMDIDENGDERMGDAPEPEKEKEKLEPGLPIGTLLKFMSMGEAGVQPGARQQQGVLPVR